MQLAPITDPRFNGVHRAQVAADGDELPEISLLNLASLSASSPLPRPWRVPGLIPGNNVTQISGDGATGKTLLTLQLMVCTALGHPWLGRDVEPGAALGIFCEDDADELHRRLVPVCDYLGAKLSDLEGRLFISSRVNQESELLTYKGTHDLGSPSPFYKSLDQLVADLRPGLIVLDSLHDLFSGNENSRPHARRFVGTCRALTRHVDGSAVVLNAHPSAAGLQSGTGTAGNTAWNNAVRSRLYLQRPEDAEGPDLRILTTKKSNYAQLGEMTALRWQDGVFVVDADAQSVTKKLGHARSKRKAAVRLPPQLAKALRVITEAIDDAGRPAPPHIAERVPPGVRVVTKDLLDNHLRTAGLAESGNAAAFRQLWKRIRERLIGGQIDCWADHFWLIPDA